jgi:hypothetical protein
VSVYLPLMALQNNDTAFYFNVTFNDKILNLTPYTVKAFQKASANVTDASGITYMAGSGLTILSAPLGQVKLVIPHANVPVMGTQWWHLDLVDGSGGVYTVFYGALTIKAV